MADSRKKTHHILLSTDGKNIALELFDAALWPAQSSTEGLFRVRIDGKWHSPAGKYTFLPYPAVADLVASLLSGQAVFEEETPPALYPKQWVHVHCGECSAGLPMSTQRGSVVAEPWRGVDGRWYVHVSMYGGVRAVPAHDVEPARRGCV